MSDPVYALISTNPFGLSNAGASPTFVDIDADDDLDVFVGNSAGNTLFFRNTGAASNPVFAVPETNPFGLSNVGFNVSPTFVDIDGDNDLDAFVGNSAGNTLFFRNTGTASNPVFAAAVTNPFSLSDVGSKADPTFVDIDGDGDLDAFVGNYDGNTLFFRNTGAASNPVFAAAVTNPFSMSNVSGYAAPTFVDIDSDGDLDAFIGSGHFSGYRETLFLRNIGTVNSPTFYYDSSNPFGLRDVGNYPSPAFVDIDADGDLDAFVGNAAGNTTFFRNTGADSTYFSRGGTLSGLSNVGLNDDPTFVDIDGDGDLDAFVGTGYDYYDTVGGGDTLFFENTGTADSPVFAAAITNPFGLSDVGSFASPTFVDIDDDDDLDAFVGNSAGNTLFFRNTGTTSGPVFAAPETNPFGLSDVGKNATPTLADIDSDGDLDAFVNNVFFENTGTASNPVLAAPEANPFGLSGLFSTTDFVDIDHDGDLDAFSDHPTQFFMNTGTASNPVFAATEFNPVSIDRPRISIRSQTLVDIDGDGDFDAYVTEIYSRYGEVASAYFSINNHAPNVANLMVAETYTKNTPLNLTDIVISDADSDNVTATLTLSNIATGSLSTATSGMVTSVYNADTGTWIASGALADVNALLAGVVFTPAANFTEAFTMSTRISDGTAAPLLGSKSFSALLVSTPGNDILTGTASSNDTVTYASASAAVTVSLNIITQQNTMGAGLDTLISVENLIGSDFNDNLTGNTANNVLDGKAGNDTLIGWSGADTMIGGSGNDSYFVENMKDKVIEHLNQGTDTVNSRITYTLPIHVENLTLSGTSAVNGTGNDQANIITGNTMTNLLNGGAGNNTLNGGIEADTLIGGLGNDTYFVENVGDIVIENLNQGNDSVNSNVTYSLSTNVENLILTGVLAINGTGNDQANVITGNNATNQLNGGTGNDILNGGAGDDTLIGWSGADTMVGELGNDSYFVENVGDVITENLNEGTDNVSSRVTYILPTNVENLILTGVLAINGSGNDQANVITGNTAANQLNGGAGNDILNGGSGVDTLIGGLGNDNYVVEDVGDIVTEILNQGTDNVSSRLTYTLPANVENLTLTGTSAVNGTGNGLANVITGNTANNQLNGGVGNDIVNDGAGNDTLNGGAGNDTLDGGIGTNTLTGGTGNDVFKFTTLGHIDTITDYNVANDTIQLENGVFTSLTTTGTLAVGQFRIGTQALDANDFIIYNNVTGALLYDANGNGAGTAVQIATIGLGLAMTNTDIVVI